MQLRCGEQSNTEFEPSSSVPRNWKERFLEASKKGDRQKAFYPLNGIKFCSTHSVFETLTSDNLSFRLSNRNPVIQPNKQPTCNNQRYITSSVDTMSSILCHSVPLVYYQLYQVTVSSFSSEELFNSH